MGGFAQLIISVGITIVLWIVFFAWQFQRRLVRRHRVYDALETYFKAREFSFYRENSDTRAYQQKDTSIILLWELTDHIISRLDGKVSHGLDAERP